MGDAVPAGQVFLEEEPFIAVLPVLAVEYLELLVAPALLVHSRVQVVDIPASKEQYLSLH